MKFLSLEDLTETFEAVIFPDAYSRYAESTLSMGPYLLEGKVDNETGHNLIVEKLEILSSEKVKSVTQKDSAENKYFGDIEKVAGLPELALAVVLCVKQWEALPLNRCP